MHYLLIYIPLIKHIVSLLPLSTNLQFFSISSRLYRILVDGISDFTGYRSPENDVGLFDENDDGTIEIEEIEHILEGCSRKLPEGEVKKLFHEMDINNDGKIDITEFTAGCRKNDILLKNIGIR